MNRRRKQTAKTRSSMTVRYHRIAAQIFRWWRITLNIPKAITWDDEDFTRRTMLTIVGRAAESRYHHKYAEQQVCGCYAIGDYYTSYLSDCELHGLDAIFGDKFKPL